MIRKSTAIADFIVANGLQEPNNLSPARVLEMFTQKHGTVHKPSGKFYTGNDVSNAYAKLRKPASPPMEPMPSSNATALVNQIVRMSEHLTQPERQKVIKHLCIEWDLPTP